MTLEQIDTKLDEIKSAIAQWQVQGYTPTIEKGCVLHKLQQVYDELCGGKPVPTEKPIESKSEVETQVSQVAPTVEKTALVLPPFEEGLQTVAQKKPIIEPKQENLQTTLILGQRITTIQRDTFMRELFWRDEAFFANEIRKFQEIKSFDDALIYVGEKYNWSASNIYAEQFIALLENYYK